MDFHRGLRHVLHEALEAWFHVDHSFLHGFYDLLFRPGRMTVDFNAGRRARHVPPFRFYVVISLLFFFVFFRSSHDSVQEVGGGKASVVIGGEQNLNDIQLDLGLSPERNLAIRKTLLEKAQHPERTLAEFAHAVPKALLVCLPFLALLTRVAYWKKPYFYIQHLVYAIHLHSFVFLWWIVAFGWSSLVGLALPALSTWANLAAFLYAVYYYYASMRRSFSASRGTAIALGTLVGGAYFLLVATALLVTLLITLICL